MADLIKAGELKERMKKVPEWELEKKHIERTFEFDDFADAIDFVVPNTRKANGGYTLHLSNHARPPLPLRMVKYC